MDEILSNVPPYPQYTAEPRYSYVVVGKPGCGKSTLAAKLAQYVDAKLITTRDLLQQALNPELNPHGHKVPMFKIGSGPAMEWKFCRFIGFGRSHQGWAKQLGS
jgi:superfamily II DNA or RNA helicase